MPLSDVLQKIVEWLRAGYPEGVPESDYVPLFALLAERLNDEDTAQIVEELKRQGKLNETVTPDMVRSALIQYTERPALEHDFERIKGHLTSVGWVFPASTHSED